MAHYRQNRFNRLIYKAIPTYYHRHPCDDDIYALHHAGGRMLACKLSSVVNLQSRRKISERRRRGIKKATKAGITVFSGNEYAPQVWQLVEENLQTHHNTKPTHTPEEILRLAALFPDNIKFYIGMVAETPVCVITIFATPTVWHAQYIAANDTGRCISGLDFLFDDTITQATTAGMRYFSFGISDEPPGCINSSMNLAVAVISTHFLIWTYKH